MKTLPFLAKSVSSLGIYRISDLESLVGEQNDSPRDMKSHRDVEREPVSRLENPGGIARSKIDRKAFLFTFWHSCNIAILTSSLFHLPCTLVESHIWHFNLLFFWISASDNGSRRALVIPVLIAMARAAKSTSD